MILINIDNNNNNSNYKLIILLLFILLVILLLLMGVKSYASYKEEIDVKLTNNTGSINCEVITASDDSYIEDDKYYFYVYVKNYKDGNLSDTDISYDLTITSNEDVTFTYEDNEYSNNFEINDITLNNDTYKEDLYKVYVSYETEEDTSLDINVMIDAIGIE